MVDSPGNVAFAWVQIGMSEDWIDQGAAPSLAATVAAIDQGGIAAVNVYMGGRDAFLGGPPRNRWTPQFVQSIATARPVAFFGSWVSLVPGQGGYALGHQDGLDAAAAARGYSMIRWLSYDVEPAAFDANPTGAADAMRGFTDAVHSQSFLSMPYSVPRGLAAGAGGADAIWIANPNPGGEDPGVQPLDPAFFAGRRSVQCCLLIAAGVDWDLSHSQFSIGGPSMTDDQIREAIYQWYWTILGRFPNDADKAAIEARWLAAYKASPLQARFDFGVQAQADVGAGKNLGLVRHFELDAAIAAVPAGPAGPPGPAGPVAIHRHRLGPNATLGGTTELTDPPTPLSRGS